MSRARALGLAAAALVVGALAVALLVAGIPVPPGPGMASFRALGLIVGGATGLVVAALLGSWAWQSRA